MVNLYTTICDFTRRVWDTNDPLEIIPCVKLSDGRIGVYDQLGTFVDIAPCLQWQLRGVTASDYDRDGEVSISSATTSSSSTMPPTFFPKSSSHLGKIKKVSLKVSGSELTDGDLVLVLKTQRPVTYILLGKIGRADGT